MSYIQNKIIRIFQLIKRWGVTTYFSAIADVVILGTPNHENLGDHAITVSERQLLYSIKSNLKIAEINGSVFDDLVYLRNIHVPVPIFFNKKIVTLYTGGGFLGDIWKLEEHRFRNAIDIYKDNKFIVCPQTICFTQSDKEGEIFLNDSKRIYESHPNLKIFLRERKSYDFMKTFMPNVKICLVPDIVACIEPPVKAERRKGILICLRDDCEGIITSGDAKMIVSELNNKFGIDSVHITSTIYKQAVKISRREKIVYDKLQEFSSARLIVTDRLHAMIFSAVTSTPCIAFDNLSKKVSGVYEWIKDNEYIKVVDGIKGFKEVLYNLDIDGSYEYNSVKVKKAMVPFIEELRKGINNHT